ncbi:MAG: response regulator [Chlamydiae bacterium]|nr:response regulator [Chlamydiota bacterium]MBI3277626.1 response regulator [Chlamydiota bacterium]
MGKKILIVDDELDYAFMVQGRLEHNGYDVFIAEDGEEALKKATREKPDVILLDILMPIMDGYTTLKKLKSQNETKDIPVIMFSAKGQPEDLAQAKTFRAFDYIIKPFDPPELLGKIEKAMKK